MTMIKRLTLLFALCTAFVLTGCEDFDQSMEYSQYINPARSDGQRTLLVYLAMNNDLGSEGYALANVKGLLAGASSTALANGRIVVYRTIPGKVPALLEIKVAGSVSYVDTLKYYPDQGSSVSPQVLREVIEDTKSLAPGRSYSLIVGSHSSGWQPRGGVTWSMSAGLLKAKAVSDDRPDGSHLTRIVMQAGAGTGMELYEMAGALHDGEFDYILFDACNMGQVEVAYALRNKARWIVASPAEVLKRGFPYKEIVGDLMASEPRLAEVCRKFYESYMTDPDAYMRTATIGLYDCSKLDALAAAMKPIVTTYRAQINSMTSTSLVQVQRFDTSSPFRMFDLEDFVHQLIASPSDPLRVAFDQALSQVVLYKATTPTIMYSYQNGVAVNTFCGISTYIPANAFHSTANNYYFTNTAWGAFVYN